MICQRVEPAWRGSPCIVAATGPSLTQAVVQRCFRAPGICQIAVNDAWRLMPWADMLYACDAAWWQRHECKDFRGEKWSSHHANGNDKIAVAAKYGLHLIAGKTQKGFSFDPTFIHYGGNSGFQAINLAILRGANPIILVGFDMQSVHGVSHFFGEHPKGLQRSYNYQRFVPAFVEAAKLLPRDIQILNATPSSALKCFPSVTIDEALTMRYVAA